jgi:hypothetical protein
MGNSRVLVVATTLCLSLFTGASAQQLSQSIPCPQGQSPIAEKMKDGTLNWGCSSRFGGGPVGHLPLVGIAQSCAKDSDCPGDTRCQGGTCGRTGMLCNADSECKYSEFCDGSKKQSEHFRGTCAPKGGHY